MTDINAENYADLIRQAGLTRAEIADEDGNATDAIKVLLMEAPILLKIAEEWALIVPSIDYAEFLAVDENWLEIVKLVAEAEKADEVEDATDEN